MKLKIPNKESIFFGAAAAGIAVCIVIQCVTLHSINRIVSDVHEDEVVICNVTPEISGGAIYRLYECGGKIGIYDAGTEVIIDIIDIFVSTLPKNDREALKKGIDIYSFTELSKIIDDFTT
ncbi:MAG: hypothetical protein IJ002_05945 [Clostridia bacterium]|nr:hypothetical protein [Clostridia bacterium]